MGRERLTVGTYGQIGTGVLPDGRWRAWARYRDTDGRVRVVVAYGRTGAHATRCLKDKLATRTAPHHTTKTGTLDGRSTVEALGIFWAERLRTAGKLSGEPYAAGTLTYYVQGFKIINQGLGHLRLSEVTAARLEQFLDGLVATGAPSTAGHARKCLILAFRLAVKQGAIPTNPAAALSPVPSHNKPVKALRTAEVQALHKALKVWEERPVLDRATGLPLLRADGTPVGKCGPPQVNPASDVIALLAGTGLRIGEALALLWDEIDLTATPPTLTVTGTIINQAPFERQPHPKSASSVRTVQVPPFAAAVLRRRFAASGPANTNGAVFFTRGGGWVRAYNVRKALRKAINGTKFEGVSPHALRAAVATLIADHEGSGASAAQLGHGHDAVTIKHYIEKKAPPAAPDFTELLEAFGPGTDGLIP